MTAKIVRTTSEINFAPSPGSGVRGACRWPWAGQVGGAEWKEDVDGHL